MKIADPMRRLSSRSPRSPVRAGVSGSVLILVLWITFGLVVLAVHFAGSMAFELRGAENRAALAQARQALFGACRYAQFVLAQYATNGAVPRFEDYLAADVPIGEAGFWFIGRGDERRAPEWPVFGLVDEASKLNLNTATAQMLEALPRMTPELAAAIIDWRDTNEEPSANGAEAEIYQRMQPARSCKNAPFDSTDELRLVAGAELEILFGEDINLNGILDPNENDGDESPPYDNRDGRLDAGILEHVTVYSREPNNRADGSRRINVNTGRQQLSALLQESFGPERAAEIMARLGQNPNLRSTLEFCVRAGLSAAEFAQIHTEITVSNNAVLEGLINANTASEQVLACVPGIGLEHAASLVAFRMANPDRLDSIAWVGEVLDAAAVQQCGPFLTGLSYQFTADVAAVGRFGRGYQRARFVIDLSDSGEAPPKVIYRQELTALGWALGSRVRETILLARHNRL